MVVWFLGPWLRFRFRLLLPGCHVTSMGSVSVGRLRTPLVVDSFSSGVRSAAMLVLVEVVGAVDASTISLELKR